MKKDNILTYLFFCIIINIIPSSMLEILEITERTYVLLNAIAYTLTVVIMLYAVRNNIKKISNKKVITLMLFFLLQVIAQINNYINQGNIQILDIIHNFSVIINIFIFILCASYFEVKKEDILKFMKKMVTLGLFACLYNIMVNGGRMLQLFKIDDSYKVSFSSFFPNRNQFGIFMQIMLLSNLYIKHNNKHRYYRYLEWFFIINLILTMSRTSIIGMVLIYSIKTYLDFIASGRILKKKFLFISFMILIAILLILFVFSNEKYIKVMDTLFIRSTTLQTGSGRTKVWQNGIDMLFKNNALLGIGRFNAIHLNKSVYNSSLNYFHSIYIEIFVIYGILGLTLLLYLFKYIIKRVKRSSLENEYKHIVLTSVFVFMIISLFETTTRFSIGYADMIGMIYFITIPIIFSSRKLPKRDI